MNKSLERLSWLALACMLGCICWAYGQTFPQHSPAAIMPIIPDGPEMDAIGYNDCNMQTNGESQVVHLIRKGGIVFDVGCHLGEWSLTVLQHEKNVTIYGFEPLPMLYNKLSENLDGCPVSIHPFALSNVKQETTIVYYPEHPGLSTLHQRPEVEKQLGLTPIALNIQTELLDSFAKEHQITHIDFLKIDTEGHEWAVLQGAQNLLANRSITYIQFEYGGCYLDSKKTLEQVYNYLTGFRYSIYRITPNGLIEIARWRPELENFMYSNYLAVMNESSLNKTVR